MYIKNGSNVRFSNTTIVKDANLAGIALNNNSSFESPGVSGNTGSSLRILSCARGIQVDNNSRFDVGNALIRDTRYGAVATNASSFSLFQSEIYGDSYSVFNGNTFGVFLSDASVGSIYSTSITGYTGGTGSATAANASAIKNSTLLVGTTAQSSLVNTNLLGASLAGDVIVDTSLGNILSGGRVNVTYYPDVE
jgi:hypothetical protein